MTASMVELGVETPDLTEVTVTVSPSLSVADIDPQDEFNEKYGS